MYKHILVPVDLGDAELARPAIKTACALAKGSGGSLRLVNVMPMTPVMLAEYVPPDFDVQQRKSAEDALATITTECGLESGNASAAPTVPTCTSPLSMAMAEEAVPAAWPWAKSSSTSARWGAAAAE